MPSRGNRTPAGNLLFLPGTTENRRFVAVQWQPFERGSRLTGIPCGRIDTAGDPLSKQASPTSSPPVVHPTGFSRQIPHEREYFPGRGGGYRKIERIVRR
jgi:hypothetical protein